MEDIYISLIVLVSAIILVGAFSYWEILRLKKEVEKKEEKMRRSMYELAILKELEERTGYSLNVQNIIDIITGSLNQFIDYSVASYMFVEPEKIIFKVHLEKSVSRDFINEMKSRMMGSLTALLNKDFGGMHTEEVISGAILVDEIKEPVRSFFNIPLVIVGKVVGVLTIADTRAGLYREEEMTILYKITKQASSAITSLQEVVDTEQRKLNAMVESINEGVVMTDKEYKIMVANPAILSALRLKPKDDLTIFDFVDKLGGKFDIRGKLEESVKLDKNISEDNVLINDKYFQIFVSPVKSSYGMTKNEILGAVVIFHDITPIKEVEIMRQDFTSMMVHELRSPLDNIKKISEVLLKKKVPKSQAEYLEFVFQDSSRMLELVNDLLDVAKLEAGKFEIYKQPSDIREIVRERANFFKTSAQFANLSIDTFFDRKVPEKVNFDPVRIVQVLNNLISNAIKFTPQKGSIAIQALIHKKGQDISEEAELTGIKWFINNNSQNISDAPDSLIVAVTDSGIGISKDKLGQLFTKFKQFKISSDYEKKGTGLGLVVVKGVVEEHGGMVGAESLENKGSSFYIILPLQEKNDINK